MSKYIDTEKIIAFLEKEKAEHIIGGDYSDGVLDTCDNILAFIDSLQQEQEEADTEEEDDGTCPVCGCALDAAGCCGCCGYGRR